MKLSTTTVLGATVTAAVLAAMVGCTPETASSADEASSEESTTSTTAQELRWDDDRRGNDCDDRGPSAARGVKDPGVRGGAPGGGEAVEGLNVNELALYNRGRFRSIEREATSEDSNEIPQGSPVPVPNPGELTNSAGVGPRFNDTSCTAGCHAYPAIGGSAPFKNPAFDAAKFRGGKNRVPWFETKDGPIREARFLFNEDGTRDGHVHQLFTIEGRRDAASCKLAQPDFEGNRNNIAFRIPTPLFGMGFIDGIMDKEILKHKNSNLAKKKKLGIHGHTNNSGNDGTINRFGWKAQNKSMTQFAGEAYVVEVGISNDLNPQPTDETDGCLLVNEPADQPHVGLDDDETVTDRFSDPVNVLPVWMTFVTFMRTLDMPKAARQDASARRGAVLFEQVGCSECHTPVMKTRAGINGAPLTEALRGKEVPLFSDLLVHHMGSNLADNIIQGGAGPDEFRSAPLWGVGQRVFFLHDGRTNSLVDAIMAHWSSPTRAKGRTPAYPASEANKVVENFADLSSREQQDVVNFLRTL